ncbi:MAG TPA: SUMF1/EgtB/PvdO family nonheme iron enzyme [Anaerolineaceae bacterium]|mgnify:CR=1 FL=1|nr:SUMF1/EgtB/PvdO family nonheme iron enzyme [Anaerolineaceae bacterium]HQH86119.1 SUMF1/EgtB/PvdO family nonheme iron enzyme [Anaerolineaceae bacterium]
MSETPKNLIAIVADWFKKHPLVTQAGADLIYGGLVANALLPLIAAQGEMGATLALAQLLGNVGAGLIVNLIQGWKDKTDEQIARQVLGAAKNDADLRATLDQLLQKLEVIHAAEAALPEKARQEFRDILQTELKKIGSSITIKINTDGGSVIQGDISAGTFIARDQWNIYLSAAGKGRLSEEDFQKVLKSYLEWVQNFHSKARLWGLESLQVTGDRPVRSLTDVFVPLSLCRFTPPRRDEVEKLAGESTNGLERTKAYLRLVEERQHEGQDIDLQALLTSKNRLAVIGGPGCGKSTLLSWLAAHLAVTAASGKHPPFDLPDGRMFLLPLIIPLRDYAPYLKRCQESREQVLRDAHTGTFFGFVLDYLKKITGMQLSEDFFERLLLGGGCLVMLDGLDEVVKRDQRAIVRQQVDNLVDGYPKNYYLVTAREAGYQQDAVFGDNFLRLDVKRLEDEAISALVTNWCQQLYPENVSQSAGEIMTAIGEINARSSDKDLPPLVSTPLMVTMVVSVKFGKTELPRERAKLYEAAVEVILQAQYTPTDDARKEVVDWGGPWTDQRDWLSLLAYEMQSGGSAGAAISEEQLRAILGRTLKPDQLEQFILAVRGRGGLLVERAELFQFLHLSFQEFLAARRIAKQRDAALLGLERHLPDSWWRETLLLTYGFSRLDYREFAEKYLGWLSNRTKGGEIRLSGLELAGAALLEIETPDAADQQAQAEKLVTVLQDQEIRAPAIVRARAGDILARLGDPRFRADAFYLPDEPLQGFIHIPAGRFTMGSDKKKDPQAYDSEQPQHEVELGEYYIARYPVTVAQFKAFVESSKYKPGDPDCLRGLPNHPVVWVSWDDALAYCDWLTAQLPNLPNLPPELKCGWRVSLPSEAEWERAARGTDGRIYPWGNEFDPNKANVDVTGIGGTSAVGCFPSGASPSGLLDASGNVWEWTRSLWGKDGQKSEFTYPYSQRLQDRENLQADRNIYRILRGGSWNGDQRGARCAVRYRYNPDFRYNNIGFRVSLSPL